MKPNTAARTEPLIDAVVVSFRPDVPRLARLLNAIAPQVRRVHLVDNGDGSAVRPLVDEHPEVNLVPLGRNLGIGAAQNAGASTAWSAGATHVLLLDQDSEPAPDMVAHLLAAEEALQAQGLRVGAVGPQAPSHGAPGAFVRFGWFGYREVPYAPDAPWVRCDLLIASGCLMSREAWLAVGPMNEALFIDKVDTEWCLRAAARGWVLAGAPRAVLSHHLGEHTLRVWWGRWKHLPVHRPFRYYYIVRNGLALCRLPHAHWRWRSADLKQSLLIAFFFGVFSPDRWANLRHMMRGAWHGLLGRLGPLDQAASEAP